MIAWDHDYKVGMKELDAEHLILFSIINQIDINIAADQTGELVEDVLGALASYVAYHFEHEEALMRRHGYAGLDDHAASHRRLSEALAKLNSGAPDVSHAVRIRKFAIDWLVDHILQEDADFAAFVRGE